MVFATRTIVVAMVVGVARHARSPASCRRCGRPACRPWPPCATPRRARRRSASPARVVRLLASVLGRAGRARRRLRRPARAPQRDAQPRPHGRHRLGDDDRRRAGHPGHGRGPGPARRRRPARSSGASTPTHVVTGADGWSPTDPAVARDARRHPGRRGRHRDPPGRRARVRRQGGRELGRPEDRRRAVHVRLGRRRRRACSTGLAADGAIVDEGWATEHGLGVGDRVLDHLAEGRRARPDRARHRGLAGHRRDRARPDHDLAGRLRRAPSSTDTRPA